LAEQGHWALSCQKTTGPWYADLDGTKIRSDLCSNSGRMVVWPCLILLNATFKNIGVQ
jgi:hypothetical protein